VLGIVPVNVRRWPEHETMLRHIRRIGAEHELETLAPVPNSRAVLRYSLAGGLWRQVAMALIEREPGATATAPAGRLLVHA
jgi:hypothetical protein